MIGNTNCFVLKNCLAAISAFKKCENIFATDGKECNIHVFDSNGVFLERVCTLRQYNRLRYSASNCICTALSCDCSPRVYYTDENFNELGYTLLNIYKSDGCKSIGTLTDASITTIGNENFLIGAFEKNVFLFDTNGNRLNNLCNAENGEIITDFISFGTEKYAMGTLKGSLQSITIFDSGETQSAILNSKLTLRMLFESNECIYGLFGYGYIYNRIVPIYTNCKLTLPTPDESNCILCSHTQP